MTKAGDEVSDTKMRKCPFCNGKAELNIDVRQGYIDKKGNLDYAVKTYTVRCLKCGCQTYNYERWADAIKAWNRREAEQDEKKI